MRVLKLFVKPQFGAPMLERQQLQLVEGYGIQDDVNAEIGSPRQLLILDLPSLQQFGLVPGDLRENILLDQGIETLISGHILQIGAALIRPTFLCEPCAYLNKIRPGLVKEILGRRGFLGMVVRGGNIAIGDGVVPTTAKLPFLTDYTRGRFDEFVARVPPGKIVTTADIVVAMGVSNAHYRVIPTFIKKALPELPVHRIVTINGSLLTKYIPNQAEQLRIEGVQIQDDIVSLGDRWQPDQFHPSF